MPRLRSERRVAEGQPQRLLGPLNPVHRAADSYLPGGTRAPDARGEADMADVLRKTIRK